MVNDIKHQYDDEYEYYYYPTNIEKYLYEQNHVQPYYAYHPYLPMYDFQYGSQWSPEQKFLNQFLDDHGQVNVEKMLKTISQFANTIQQVSPVIKQINDLVRNMRSIQT